MKFGMKTRILAGLMSLSVTLLKIIFALLEIELMFQFPVYNLLWQQNAKNYNLKSLVKNKRA